jgi:hypothetical protein
LKQIFPGGSEGNSQLIFPQNFDDVIGPAPTTVLGIQQAAQKGIAGRAVLLDFAGWAETQNISYSAFTVSLPHLYF